MKFLSNDYYHVYNRGNNKQLIFQEEENYRYFLQKIRLELTDYVSIIAYCLMPNHYHLLLYTHPDFCERDSIILSRKLGTLQSSYTQAYNKRYNFVGSLFQQKLKSKCLNQHSDHPLLCFHYIHQNPLKAGLVDKMEVFFLWRISK